MKWSLFPKQDGPAFRMGSYSDLPRNNSMSL